MIPTASVIVVSGESHSEGALATEESGALILLLLLWLMSATSVFNAGLTEASHSGTKILQPPRLFQDDVFGADIQLA